LVLRENNIKKLMSTIVQCVHIGGKIVLDGIKISVDLQISSRIAPLWFYLMNVPCVRNC
jgi:hypothetical protein